MGAFLVFVCFICLVVLQNSGTMLCVHALGSWFAN